MSELEQLAQAAYAAYGASTGGLNFRGEPMPQWADLGDRIQSAWRAAVKASISERSNRPVDEPAECQHCHPRHGSPARCAWGVRLDSDVDGDGQPTRMIVQPSNGAHVAQDDVTWLWRIANGVVE